MLKNDAFLKKVQEFAQATQVVKDTDFKENGLLLTNEEIHDDLHHRIDAKHRRGLLRYSTNLIKENLIDPQWNPSQQLMQEPKLLEKPQLVIHYRQQSKPHPKSKPLLFREKDLEKRAENPELGGALLLVQYGAIRLAQSVSLESSLDTISLIQRENLDVQKIINLKKLPGNINLDEILTLYKKEAQITDYFLRKFDRMPAGQQVIFHYDKIRNKIIIGMPWLGRDLCEEKKFLSKLNILKALTDVASQMLIMHKEDMLHRDIKLANVAVLNKKTQGTLLDFGFSEKIENVQAVQRIVGTETHLSPKLRRAIHDDSFLCDYTRDDDCYALGVTIAEAIEGVWRDEQGEINFAYNIDELVDANSDDHNYYLGEIIDFAAQLRRNKTRTIENVEELVKNYQELVANLEKNMLQNRWRCK